MDVDGLWMGCLPVQDVDGRRQDGVRTAHRQDSDVDGTWVRFFRFKPSSTILALSVCVDFTTHHALLTLSACYFHDFMRVPTEAGAMRSPSSDLESAWLALCWPGRPMQPAALRPEWP